MQLVLQGGRLFLFPQHSLDEVFLALVFLIAGSSLSYLVTKNFPTDQEVGKVSGVVGSRRQGGDRIEIWLSGSEKEKKVPGAWLERLKDVLRSELELDEVSICMA